MTFFSVGGYGTGQEAGPELQSKASNEDFAAYLSRLLLWQEALTSSDVAKDFRFCKVPSNNHSEGYLHAFNCDGDLPAYTMDVLQAMVIFLQNAVT